MPTDTDLKLRSWLDANQRDREHMCRAVLALDQRYSEVRPRHPLGGPDGGRDIEAQFLGNRKAYGAVGFVNGANDSDDHKRQIQKKFSDDLKSAFKANLELKAFVFLTNVNLTMGEQDELKQRAKDAGLEHCDILDRERIRIELDSPSGFFIRFQYLSIPLSEAEQASFLSRYGSQIQDVVTTGFQKVEKTLNRLLFIAESSNILGTLTFKFVLKESYPASDVGHVRAFVSIFLREIKHDIFQIWFGTSDKSDRFRDDIEGNRRDMTPGIGYGRASGQWEQHVRLPNDTTKGDDNDEDKNDGDDDDRFVQVGCSSGVGIDPVDFVFASYSHDDSLIRFRPRLSLRDLDGASFLPVLNTSLAEKLHSFEIFANGYKLASYGPKDFTIDRTPYEGRYEGDFTEEELSDRWVRIRPSWFSSSFEFHFASTTPRRLFEHEEPGDATVP